MMSGMERISTDAIWARFSGRLRAFIARRVRDESDLEDVLQEVFVRIHAGLGSLRADEKLEAWLFGVARRAVVDHFRGRSGKRRAADLPKEPAEPAAAGDVAAEVASWLVPMMELLPEEDREALRLTDLEGLSQKALAARLGLSATGARSRVQRARRRLRETLLDCCHIELDRRGRAIAYTRRRAPCASCSCP